MVIHRLLSIVVDVSFGRLHKNHWINGYFCHNFDKTNTIKEWGIFLNLIIIYNMLHAYPNSMGLQIFRPRYLDASVYMLFYLGTDFYLLFSLNLPSRSGQSVMPTASIRHASLHLAWIFWHCAPVKCNHFLKYPSTLKEECA